MTDNDTILITGSGGFIGGWIAETLHLNGLANVRAGIRSWSSAARLARFPIDIVLCDVMNEESISQAMTGVNCVIHCVSGSRDAIIDGTRNLLQIAQAQKIKRFVHISTTEVYGNVHGEINEDCPFQSNGNPYADAKIEAEKLCWEYYKKGVPVTIVRPSIVYGPFSRDWTARFAQRLQSGDWGIFEGYGEGICNLIYVADLVSGILLAVQKECAIGEAFNLVGSETITWNQYFQRFSAALGLPELNTIAPANTKLRATAMGPIRSLGKFVLKHFSTPLRKMSQKNQRARELMQFADKSIKNTPTFAELSLFDRKALYLTTKARKLLGYQPAYGIDSGLDLSAQWLKSIWLA